VSTPEATSEPAVVEALSQRQILVVLSGALTGLTLSALDTTIVNTAMATIVGELGGLRSYTWIGTSYLLTTTAATPLFGKLSDVYGRRALFQVAIAVFMVGSLACGLAQDMTQLVLARALQGVGGGGLFALAFTILGDVVSPRERGRYVGYFTSVFTVASVVGPLLGGFFVDVLHWRWIFLVNLPIGAVAMVVTSRVLRLPWSRQNRSIDVIGALLLVISTSALLLAVSWSGSEHGWTSGTTLGLLAVAGVVAAVFLWWEQRVDDPIVPLRLFRIDVIRVIAPVMFIAGALLYNVSAFLPLFLQSVTGVSPTTSGLLLIPLAIALAISGTLIGRRIATTGRYKHWPVAGFAAMGVGFGVLSLLQGSATWVVVSMGAMVLLGFGIGAVMPTSTVAAQNAVEWTDLGAASSLILFLRSLGGAIGLAVWGAILNARLAGKVAPELLQRPRDIRNLPEPLQTDTLNAMTDAITATFGFTVPLAVVGFVLLLALPERPLRTTSALSRSQSAQADHTSSDAAPTS
jgi:EmrB/QacA subfamily drug resistance transporter